VTSVAPDGGAIPTRGAWFHPEQPAEQHSRRNASSVSVVFVLGISLLLVALAAAMATTDYDFWGGLFIGTILLVLTSPLASRIARREGDPKVGRVVLLALLTKLAVGTAMRYAVAYYVYRTSDAEAYFKAGIDLAPQFRSFDFGHLGNLMGTHFVEVLSGIVIAIINESRSGCFVVFSWMAFLGMYLFYCAFRIAFPEGDHKRYRLLVFFWPSMVFWPSSLGKDAWMVWMLGMCALGVANLLIGRWRGFAWLGLGSLGCIMVRPHLALIVVAGFALGLLLRRNRGAYSRLLARPAGTALLMVGMIAFGAVTFAATQSFFKLDSLDLESAQGVLDSTTLQTSEGGTAFTPPSPTSPLGYVESAVTVLFRPFPTEVTGAAAISALEGIFLFGLCVVSWKRLIRIIRMSLRNAYVAFAVGYTAVFIFAFASISNFGILARERSQLFPVLFILLAIPKKSQESDELDDMLDDDTSVVVAT
jgi:hypothetical protein